MEKEYPTLKSLNLMNDSKNVIKEIQI